MGGRFICVGNYKLDMCWIILSYNFKQHLASDIGVGQLFYLPPENVKSQEYLDNIPTWTHKNKMNLNEEKTKVELF